MFATLICYELMKWYAQWFFNIEKCDRTPNSTSAIAFILLYPN
ncbi:hypothetical protein [Nostoc cycadae]|nr:hypothetical protein [Nostoc cycadae]